MSKYRFNKLIDYLEAIPDEEWDESDNDNLYPLPISKLLLSNLNLRFNLQEVLGLLTEKEFDYFGYEHPGKYKQRIIESIKFAKEKHNNKKFNDKLQELL